MGTGATERTGAILNKGNWEKDSRSALAALINKAHCRQKVEVKPTVLCDESEARQQQLRADRVRLNNAIIAPLHTAATLALYDDCPRLLAHQSPTSWMRSMTWQILLPASAPQFSNSPAQGKLVPQDPQLRTRICLDEKDN